MKNNGIHIEEWISALSEQKLFYLVVMDISGRLTFLNTHFFRSLQLTSACLIINTFYDFIHPEDLNRFKIAIDECSIFNRAVIVEIRIKNGGCRWVKMEITPLKKSGNEQKKFLCLGYDIACEDPLKKMSAIGDQNHLAIGEGLYVEKDQTTAFSVFSAIPDLTKEKKLEAEVKMRGTLFKSYMNHNPYFTWIVDNDKKLIFANHSLLNYFQGDDTAFGKNIFHLIPTSLAVIFHEKHTMVVKKGLPDHSIIKSMMADGKEHVYQITVFPINTISAETMIGGEALDITKSYNARQEIRKTNEHLLYQSRATTEAIWDWNMQTGHIFCNEALHDLIGSDLNEVFDLDWCYQCIHPEDRDKLKNRIKSVLEKKEQSWEMEYRFGNNEGCYKMFCNRGFVIYVNNEPIRMIGSLQDISEMKKLETQLIEQKLKQQKGIAEAIIQSQEEERTRIGHELHDNVNQILSTAQLYLNLLDPHKDNFAEIKKKATEIILLGIEEIRILSKEMVIPTLRGDGLLTSINCIVDDLRFINQFKIMFTHSDRCDIESLSKNKKITIYRIIQEQIKNIIKHSNAKNVEISMECAKNQLRLIIQDDGIGFDSKNTRRGLGLANIYERTRLDNGKVILNTSPGNGCSLMVNITIDDKHIF
jgi:PAS domain S-box-containing protein